MVRNLYRFYLYIVCLALLVFAAVALGHLAQVVLAFTPLRGSSGSVPGSAEVVQAVVFFVISWLIVAVLGGFHYRLIRRDVQSDPAAGGSAIRTFFLNIAEGIAVVLVVALSAFAVFPLLGQVDSGDVTATTAASFAMLCLAAALEWERRRIPVGSAATLLFEHLHLYAVQLILLLCLALSWMGTVHQLVDALVFGGQGIISVGGPAPCGGFTACQGQNLLSLTGALLWIALFWIGYGLLAREEAPSLFRQVLHYASLTSGFGFILYGVERGVELLMRMVFGIPVSPLDVASPASSYDFVSPLLLGILVASLYGLWLALAGRKEEMRTLLIGEAIGASLLALVFWWGIALALFFLLQYLASAPVGAADWAAASSMMIVGVGYLAFEWYLRRRGAHEPAIAAAPRRAMVLALLGAAVLTGAVGLAVTLYALTTFFLGSPINGWGQLTRGGLSACVVGALVAGFYLWCMRDEKRSLSAAAQPPSQVMQPPVAATAPVSPPAPLVPLEVVQPSPSIEAILDDLLAGKINRDEAASRLHQLFHLQPAPS